MSNNGICVTDRIVPKESHVGEAYKKLYGGRLHVDRTRMMLPTTESFLISHNLKARSKRCAVAETGFFYRAAHVDRRGLWKECSLNHPEYIDVWMNYQAPKPARELIGKPQPEGEGLSWTGIVLLGQRLNDKSITTVSPTGDNEDYIQFVDNACRTFDEELFVKLHPLSDKETENQHFGHAKTHGSEYGYADWDIIANCQFVLTYNSMDAIECLLRGKNVMQYAPGYFYNTGAVTFSDRQLLMKACNRSEIAERLVDFLVWRYCFHRDAPAEWLADIFHAFANTDDPFPVPEERSYGAYCASEIHEIP